MRLGQKAMRWKAGLNNQKLKISAHRSVKGLLKPTRLPVAAARYLTVQLGLNQAWVKGLKCVIRIKEDLDDTHELRVFDEILAAENGVKIENYHSLDSYPELIIYKGWINQSADIAFLK
jgi:hypothetical protein